MPNHLTMVNDGTVVFRADLQIRGADSDNYRRREMLPMIIIVAIGTLIKSEILSIVKTRVNKI